MFRVTDEKGGDDKVLCVVAGDPHQQYLSEIYHLPKFEPVEDPVLLRDVQGPRTRQAR